MTSDGLDRTCGHQLTHLPMTKVQAPGHVALQQMMDDNPHCWWATQIDHHSHMYSLFARHVRPESVSAYSLLITVPLVMLPKSKVLEQ